MLKRKTVLLYMLLCLFLFSGCFKKDSSLNSMNEPKDANLVDQLENVHENENNDAETKETVERELYLLDVNGMVVPQKLELPVPETKEVATQVLEYLVKDGPVSNILPNGFQAVLPEGTEVQSVNLQEDGTITIDLSEEFMEYKAEQEKKILESITYTLTQFDNIKQIQLLVDGNELNEMPVDGTPIDKGYSRSNGINVTQSNTIDFIASNPVTLYYPAEYNDHRYYVPVTQYVQDEEENLYHAIIETLIDGPNYDVNVTDVFNDQTSLVEEPTLSDGVLQLMFNEHILTDTENAIISDEVMETLTRTLTEQHAVKAIHVEVENIDAIMNEEGKTYDDPVTADHFETPEKM